LVGGMSLSGTNEQKWAQLAKQTYKEQAIWFLNAYWKSFGEKEAENVWAAKHKMEGLDTEKGKEGSAVDELLAHRFLELMADTHTVRELREKLTAVGIEKFKFVALVHFLVFRYKVDWKVLVNAVQGDNQEELEKAQKMFDEFSASFAVVEKTAREAKEAQQELEKSLAELKAQEDAYNDKTAQLNKKIQTETGIVAQNKAKAELAQHLGEDPLPLRRAKITNEAAVKKAERAAKAAEEALDVARDKLQKAEAYLEELKSKPGSAQGALWWMDRELHEKKAFLPTSKGGYKKK